MKLVTERVTVRLTETLIDRIDSYMDQHDLDSRSDIIREALEEFLTAKLRDRQRSPGTITVDLPDQTFRGLTQLVEVGETVNIDEEVRYALKEHVEGRLEALVLREERLIRIRELNRGR